MTSSRLTGSIQTSRTQTSRGTLNGHPLTVQCRSDMADNADTKRARIDAMCNKFTNMFKVWTPVKSCVFYNSCALTEAAVYTVHL